MEHGSTQKGIGAARASRLMRTARLASDYAGHRITDDLYLGSVLCDTADVLGGQSSVLIEGTQGYGLGLHAGYYPHCTSGDCRAIDFLAQAGLPPQDVETWVVLRTFPIRIAGNSGPLDGEVDWATVGVDPEFTTVTKKMRRVGLWDMGLARAAVKANGGGARVRVALTFADYWWPELKDADGSWSGTIPDATMADKIAIVEEHIGAEIVMLGTGPKSQLIKEGSV